MPQSLTIAYGGSPPMTFLITVIFCLMANTLWYQGLLLVQNSLPFLFNRNCGYLQLFVFFQNKRKMGEELYEFWSIGQKIIFPTSLTR